MSAHQELVEQQDASSNGGDTASVSAPQSTPSVANWTTHGKLAQVLHLVESPSVFQGELVAALDEFIAVVRESRERIEALNEELAARNTLIDLLEEKNSALEAKLGSANGTNQESPPAAPAPIPLTPQDSADPSKVHGIWRRLKRLEHD